jgi:hypothetical protein
MVFNNRLQFNKVSRFQASVGKNRKENNLIFSEVIDKSSNGTSSVFQIMQRNEYLMKIVFQWQQW